MAGNSQLIQLKKELRAKKLHNIYLFYGEEAYLREKYLHDLMALIPDGGFPEFNRVTFVNRSFTRDDVSDAVESFPMMSEKKLIYFNDSHLFITKDDAVAKKPDEDEKVFWKNILKSPPADTIIIFNETSVDKKSAIYKAVAKSGFVIEFSYMQERDLTEWTLKQCLDAKVKLKKENAQLLVSLCDSGLSNIKNELDKLFSYCKDEITRNDIERVVSKPLQYRIFDLTDGILNGSTLSVLTVLNDLKTQNEPSFGTLYLLYSTFNRILKAQALKSAGKTYAEITSELGCHRFVAEKSIGYAQKIPSQVLIQLVSRVSDIDMEIKEGTVSDRDALEKYVLDAVHLMHST